MGRLDVVAWTCRRAVGPPKARSRRARRVRRLGAGGGLTSEISKIIGDEGASIFKMCAGVSSCEFRV